MKGTGQSLLRRMKVENPPVPVVARFQDSDDAYEVSLVVS